MNGEGLIDPTTSRLMNPSSRPGRPLELDLKYMAAISRCGDYRWSLHRIWGLGSCLPWIMLNPSTADGRLNDPTLWRVMQFTWRWGFDSALVVNLFPYRSPHPAKLVEWLRWDGRQDWYARDRLWENWSRVADLLAPYEAAMAAWGSPSGSFLSSETEMAGEQLFNAVNEHPLRDRPLSLFVLGSDGRPTHPLARGKHRIPDDAQPRPIARDPASIRVFRDSAEARLGSDGKPMCSGGGR